mgnify:CR=1 FL=1
MNTVSRTHDYMLEHLKEKLINERLARHRISPNLVQRLFTAAIWLSLIHISEPTRH